MAVTAATWQAQILFELGNALSGGPEAPPEQAALLAGLRAQLPTLWAMHADQPSPRLHYLYTLRQAAQTLQGQVRAKIDFTLGPLSPRQSQLFGNLKTIYDQATAEIAVQEKRLRAGRTAVLAPLQRTAPRMNVPAPVLDPGVTVPPQVGFPDPNDPAYNPGPLEQGQSDFQPR